MKALMIMQPWAALIALGIKTIETRPSPPNGDMRPDGVRGLPGLCIDRGERIAIHAAASKPACTQWEDAPYDNLGARFQYGQHSEGVRSWWLSDLDPAEPDALIDLPLGVVVATAAVVECYPVIDAHLGWSGDADTPDRCLLVDHLADTLRLLDLAAPPDDGGALIETSVDDQLPLGDFTPGRWGWLLTDVEPLPEPIPAKGKQGVWEWAR